MWQVFWFVVGVILFAAVVSPLPVRDNIEDVVADAELYLSTMT